MMVASVAFSTEESMASERLSQPEYVSMLCYHCSLPEGSGFWLCENILKILSSILESINHPGESKNLTFCFTKTVLLNYDLRLLPLKWHN